MVRELTPDRGPHERLLTVREVASCLGVSAALVYKLCQRNLLRSVRIGAALRFQPRAIWSTCRARVPDDGRPVATKTRAPLEMRAK